MEPDGMSKKKKRRLPHWMTDKNAESSIGCDQTKSSDFWFVPQQMLYYNSIPEINQACSEILEDAVKDSEPTIVGFDAEWDPFASSAMFSKIALLQICIAKRNDFHKCFLFHLAGLPEVPKLLEFLLLDSSIVKIGLNINGDLRKLERDYGISYLKTMAGSVELTTLANDVLKCSQRWSLSNLSHHLLDKPLVKDHNVRCGHWQQRPLSTVQQHYAAQDAYVSLLLYSKLQNLSSKRS